MIAHICTPLACAGGSTRPQQNLDHLLRVAVGEVIKGGGDVHAHQARIDQYLAAGAVWASPEDKK